MKHYYFVENSTGEEFLVGADSLAQAAIIAEDVAIQISREYEIAFVDLHYQYEMSEFVAENSGLDEY